MSGSASLATKSIGGEEQGILASGIDCHIPTDMFLVTRVAFLIFELENEGHFMFFYRSAQYYMNNLLYVTFYLSPCTNTLINILKNACY